MDKDLSNYIKYCLGYVRITREKTAVSQQKYSINLPVEYFGLLGLLNGDTDGNLGELINLETFYKYDPKKVPKDEIEKYEEEKAVANKIEDIYNKYQNDQFTKQIVLNFGYFEIELPIEENGVLDTDEDEEELKEVRTKTDTYPLFSLPVKIEKEITKTGAGKYTVYAVDPEIQVNIGVMESILGEDLYFQLLDEMGKYEIEGKFVLPLIELDIFKEIWHKIKAQLRHTKANFDEESFSLDEIKISLSPKANYFLAEDLAKLSKLSEEELSKTALTSWIKNDDLNIETETPHEKDLYFPFLYDQSQLATLSILANKSAIIQGPPGTGKSETISNILCHLAATGNRVLFVSQKAQALKVVKDKLKKLNIKYLFGYLPNPSSAQIGEDDEADGIAPQLASIDTYIQDLKTWKHKNPIIDQVIEKRDAFRQNLNEAVEAQRKYYSLSQELLGLKEFDIEISDFDCFAKSFSSNEWTEIKNTKHEIEKLEKIIKKYERSEERKHFENLFSNLNFNNTHYASEIEKIKNDIEKTGFDRHSRFFRKINNVSRVFRLNESLSKLPREIIDELDKVQRNDTTRSEQTKYIEALYNHCLHFETINYLENVEEKLKGKLSTCGVSDEEFDLLDQKIDNSEASNLEKIKTNVLRVQEIKAELSALSKTESANRINSALQHAEKERSQRVAVYVQNIINSSLLEKYDKNRTVKIIIGRIQRAFGKSRKAFKTFDKLRNDPDNFNAVLDIIPIWIMELDDASRLLPLQAGMFDYVILDEASQCNIAYTLPTMFRADRALFVGDKEQMRDSTIMFKSNRIFEELAHRYQIPDERQIKAAGTSVQSLLHIADNLKFKTRMLRYHYRSPAELIGFSNKNFYRGSLVPLNSNYLTYKDTNRIIVVHEVKSDWKEEISDNVNIAEAKAILELFKELRADEKYKEKSIGILSFFNAQATEIRKIFTEAGFREESDNYKVSIIEGIQGDEKDIIIYSFVIRNSDQKKRYNPLTGEGGDIRGDINKGRVNVAFSRARMQVHCFVSMPPADVPEKIWIKKYLEYAEEHGEVAFDSAEMKPFDSYFEEDFYNTVKNGLGRGYKIQNQIASCGFKIDFVISNTNTGKRIAVECDGPCHFKDEIDEAYGIHIESDEQRQRVLESAGWRFCRVKYVDWIDEKFDRDTVVETLIDLLK